MKKGRPFGLLCVTSRKLCRGVFLARVAEMAACRPAGIVLREKDLDEAGLAYYKIIGATPKEQRLKLVNQFNQDDTPVFLISLKAGGTGLNLTGADSVIHYDPWWNKSAVNQATDRAHRIGQKNVVTVYKLIIKGSIEEKILNMQEEKSKLAEEILSADGISNTLINREALMELL